MKKISLKDFEKLMTIKNSLTREQLKVFTGELRWGCRRMSSNTTINGWPQSGGHSLVSCVDEMLHINVYNP